MHNTTPALDISIVTYNSAPWIATFFKSLMQQALPLERISLLWRDNGSTDDSLRLLKQLKTEHQETFRRFEIDSGGNIGFGRGHNANLARAEAEFFLVTNVDLEFETNTLLRLLEEACADDNQTASWECRQKPFEHPKNYDPVTGATLWSSSACILFRTSALRAVRGYEPHLFMYGEDVELSYRLRDAGYVIRYVPSATVWHHTYEEAAQVKPLQYLGSTFANVLLRCRYGSLRTIFIGFLMYAALFLRRPLFPKQRSRLLLQVLRLCREIPYFLLTRHRSNAEFTFRLWDYAPARDGAFYRYMVANGQGQPLVSVIVRTMPGRGGKLQEAIASVIRQTYHPIELVIVEDGGDSATGFCQSLQRRGRFAEVKYLPLAKQGRCLAGNAALAAASGELCCFLDDDDLFYAEHLEVLVAEWQQEPTLGAVYGLAFEVRTEIVSDNPWRYRDLTHKVVYRQEFNRALLWHHNYLPIQTVLFQRKLFLEFGGFDPELENLEDWNLWVRYSLHHDFRLIPKVTSLYRVPAFTDKALQRQQILDDHYAIAQAKHAQLKIELSPPQVVEIAHTLARELYVGGVPTSRLRQLALKVPGLRLIYHPLRHAWNLWRHLRA